MADNGKNLKKKKGVKNTSGMRRGEEGNDLIQYGNLALFKLNSGVVILILFVVLKGQT